MPFFLNSPTGVGASSEQGCKANESRHRSETKIIKPTLKKQFHETNHLAQEFIGSYVLLINVAYHIRFRWKIM